jgi:hypothetical protein
MLAIHRVKKRDAIGDGGQKEQNFEANWSKQFCEKVSLTIEPYTPAATCAHNRQLYALPANL